MANEVEQKVEELKQKSNEFVQKEGQGWLAFIKAWWWVGAIVLVGFVFLVG